MSEETKLPPLPSSDDILKTVCHVEDLLAVYRLRSMPSADADAWRLINKAHANLIEAVRLMTFAEKMSAIGRNAYTGEKTE